MTHNLVLVGQAAAVCHPTPRIAICQYIWLAPVVFSVLSSNVSGSECINTISYQHDRPGEGSL